MKVWAVDMWEHPAAGGWRWRVSFAPRPDDASSLMGIIKETRAISTTVSQWCEENGIAFTVSGRYFGFNNEADATLVYLRFR